MTQNKLVVDYKWQWYTDWWDVCQMKYLLIFFTNMVLLFVNVIVVFKLIIYEWKVLVVGVSLYSDQLTLIIEFKDCGMCICWPK